ncbi:MAG: hypothetical protein WCB05_14185 [Candidatus Sulfotelmatobacter sp.]
MGYGKVVSVNDEEFGIAGIAEALGEGLGLSGGVDGKQDKDDGGDRAVAHVNLCSENVKGNTQRLKARSIRLH